MVDQQLRAGGVDDPRILSAMLHVPRHRFVPEPYADLAYDDRPLPIGHGQTISQPLIVAMMTALLDPRPGERILEVGTGSGYQAAVLSRLTGQVFTLEIVEPLVAEAARRLASLGCSNVAIWMRDGYQGLPEEAPFDGILVTAAPPTLPSTLVEELRIGGRMVVPIGDRAAQRLELVKRTASGVELSSLEDVRFVPMLHRPPP
jgi:protein-L-isoaspartate(D-aspartate) O-methyltransferase